MSKILIACLGNIFYGDDAFGVEVAKVLKQNGLPANITLTDFGIRGIDLAFEIGKDYDLVVLVDTVELGAKAGTIFVMEPKLPENSDVLTHDLMPQKAWQFARNFSAAPKKMLLVGCQPANLEFNAEMSEAVKNAIAKAAEKVLELVQKENEK